MHIYFERKVDLGHLNTGLWEKTKVCPKPSECLWDLGRHIPSVHVEITNLYKFGYKSIMVNWMSFALIFWVNSNPKIEAKYVAWEPARRKNRRRFINPYVLGCNQRQEMQSHDINYTDQWLWLEKEKNISWMFAMKVLWLLYWSKLNKKQKLLIKTSQHSRIKLLQIWSCLWFLATQSLFIDIMWISTVCCQKKNTENQNSTSLSHPRNHSPAFPKHLFALLCKPASQLAWATCSAQSPPNTERLWLKQVCEILTSISAFPLRRKRFKNLLVSLLILHIDYAEIRES